MKNSIELLPKAIEFNDDRYYELRIYVTAWFKLCLAYCNPFRRSSGCLSDDDNILTVVVEGDNKIEKKMTNDYTVIFDASDVEDAVDITLRRITALQNICGDNVKLKY